MMRLAIGAGVTAVVVVLLGIFHFSQVSAARDAGMRDERLVWQQRQAVADAAADKARREAQAKIDAAERSYLETAATADIQKSELRKALENEKASARACAAVTHELRDKLNAIGRH